MDRILPRGLPWSRSADDSVRRATGGLVRILTDEDTPALQALAAQDPVANCFVESLLQGGRLAGTRQSGSLFLGVDAPHGQAGPTTAGGSGGSLTAACWAGSNVVPVGADRGIGALFGQALLPLRRRFASVYGPQEAVRGIWSELSAGHQRARDVRDEQPLMVIEGEPQVPPHPEVRPTRPEEFTALLPAAAAMFEEELGFSPLLNGAVQYRLRLEELIQRGHSVVLTAPDGRIRFKADLGVVSRDCTQIQGVWVHPAERGRGLAAPAMAAVVHHARTVAPRVSLYVNAYNTPAVRTYERVGFTRVGTFSTILM